MAAWRSYVLSQHVALLRVHTPYSSLVRACSSSSVRVQNVVLHSALLMAWQSQSEHLTCSKDAVAIGIAIMSARTMLASDFLG